MTNVKERKKIGFSLCHPRVVKAKSAWRIGSIPFCVQLEANDLGKAVLEDGRTVYITWGANLSPERQANPDLIGDLVWISADDGSAEFILPEGEALDKILSVVG